MESARQFFSQFLPIFEPPYVVQMSGEPMNLLLLALEQVTVRNGLQITKDFQPIIDEVRHAKAIADDRLLGPLEAEMDLVRRQSGLIVEAVVLEPLQRLALRVESALGHEEHGVLEDTLVETRSPRTRPALPSCSGSCR